MDRVSQEEFSNFLAELRDAGLLDLDDGASSGGNGLAQVPNMLNQPEARRCQLVLRVQQGDVEEALETSLAAEPFYAGIIKKVKEQG